MSSFWNNNIALRNVILTDFFFPTSLERMDTWIHDDRMSIWRMTAVTFCPGDKFTPGNITANRKLHHLVCFLWEVWNTGFDKFRRKPTVQSQVKTNKKTLHYSTHVWVDFMRSIIESLWGKRATPTIFEHEDQFTRYSQYYSTAVAPKRALLNQISTWAWWNERTPVSTKRSCWILGNVEVLKLDPNYGLKVRKWVSISSKSPKPYGNAILYHSDTHLQ